MLKEALQGSYNIEIQVHSLTGSILLQNIQWNIPATEIICLFYSCHLLIMFSFLFLSPHFCIREVNSFKPCITLLIPCLLYQKSIFFCAFLLIGYPAFYKKDNHGYFPSSASYNHRHTVHAISLHTLPVSVS